MRLNRASIGWGVLLGLGLVALLDASATTVLPIVSFLPRLYYVIGGIVFGAAAAVIPIRWWRWLGLSGALVGGLCVAWMTTLTPRWQTHAGWQNCRLIAGPWYARSVVPVAVPGCGVLSMCANETRYDLGPLMREAGCPAP